MSFLHAFILGIIQGLTEFLPVSSSGHLALAQHFLGYTNLNELVFFDLVCHLGTLGAITVVFHRQIIEAFRNVSLFWQVVIGTLPLVPLVFILKPLKELFDRLDLLGFFFLLTALLLWLGEKGRARPAPSRFTPLYVGLFQACAIVPGLSRSGATLSGASLMGWPKDKAITFSFLLAIPAILGGFVLELKGAIQNPPPSWDLIPLATGFTLSFLTGILALKWLIWAAKEKNLLPFAWYCLILGLWTLFYFNRF